MLIGCDIDGVLFPWDDVVRDALVEQFGIERPGPSTSWSFLKGVLDKEQWRWLWSAEGQASVFGRTWRVYPGVVDMVDALTKNPDNKVHFVTHRDPRYTAVHTASFLARHFSRHPWAGVHVVRNSTAKRTLARWDVFVDDKPETVWDFLDSTGAVVFAPKRSWNIEDLEGLDNNDGLLKYDDPMDVARWVEARS